MARLGFGTTGTLTVSNCAVSGNSEGGLFNDGVLTVSNCVVSGNSGGGIVNGYGVLTVIIATLVGTHTGFITVTADASVIMFSSNHSGGDSTMA